MARLAALASLSERADGLPFPLRCLLLWVLRFAEETALDYVIGQAEDRGLLAWVDPSQRTERPDGAMLARRFRVLAALLVAWLAEDASVVETARGSSRTAPRRRPWLRHALLAIVAGERRPCPDTS